MKVLTTIEGVFNGFHTDPATGVVHGHDYVVRATWLNTSERYEHLRDGVAATLLADYDHKELPAWRAEEIAQALLHDLGCHQLELNRPSIGHFVKVKQ